MGRFDNLDGTTLALGATVALAGLGLAMNARGSTNQTDARRAVGQLRRRFGLNDDELLAATDVTSCPIPGSAAELSWREKYGEWKDNLDIQRAQEERLAQVYHQGFLAVQQGKTVTQNPYEAGDLRHDEWAMGWQDTQTGSGNALTLHQWEKGGRLVHILRTDVPNFRAKYAQAKRKYGLPAISSLVGAGYSHNIATVPLRLSYATYNVYQRWWWGQGDPLYVVLSRRGDSVDIVAVEATPAELERLIEVSHQILSDRHSDAGEKRTARATLTQISNLPPTNGAIGGGTVGLGSRSDSVLHQSQVLGPISLSKKQIPELLASARATMRQLGQRQGYAGGDFGGEYTVDEAAVLELKGEAVLVDLSHLGDLVGVRAPQSGSQAIDLNAIIDRVTGVQRAVVRGPGGGVVDAPRIRRRTQREWAQFTLEQIIIPVLSRLVATKARKVIGQMKGWDRNLVKVRIYAQHGKKRGTLVAMQFGPTGSTLRHPTGPRWVMINARNVFDGASEPCKGRPVFWKGTGKVFLAALDQMGIPQWTADDLPGPLLPIGRRSGSRATKRQRIAKALAGGALDQLGADELGSIQAALISAGSLNYVVQFVSVDGAGRYDEVFTDLADAKAFADTKQAESDANGNPWGYTYNVLHEKFERPPLYRTGSRALHEQGPGWTPKVFVSKQQAEDAIDNFRTQETRHYDARWTQFAGLPGPGWYIVDSDGRVIR